MRPTPAALGVIDVASRQRHYLAEPLLIKTAFVVATVLLSSLVALGGFGLKQSIENGQELARMRVEIALRVSQAEKDHASFVRHEQLAQLRQSLDDLRVEVTRLRERLEQRK